MDNVVSYSIFKLYKRCQQAGRKDYKEWFRLHGYQPVKAKPINLSNHIQSEIDSIKLRLLEPKLQALDAAKYFASVRFFLTKKHILTQLLEHINPHARDSIIMAALVDTDHRVRALALDLSEEK